MSDISRTRKEYVKTIYVEFISVGKLQASTTLEAPAKHASKEQS